MKIKEILPVFESLGWSCGKDDVGDHFCLMCLEGAQVQIIPTIGKRSGYFRISLSPSVSSEEFTAAAAFILGRDGGHEPIVVSSVMPEKLIELNFEVIVRLSQSVISWASVQDIEKGLAVYRALPTDSKGALPLRHLAALAVAGDVERLAKYQFSFVQGDRLDFVPYVTQEMISRALSLAQDRC